MADRRGRAGAPHRSSDASLADDADDRSSRGSVASSPGPRRSPKRQKDYTILTHQELIEEVLYVQAQKTAVADELAAAQHKIMELEMEREPATGGQSPMHARLSSSASSATLLRSPFGDSANDDKVKSLEAALVAAKKETGDAHLELGKMRREMAVLKAGMPVSTPLPITDGGGAPAPSAQTQQLEGALKDANRRAELAEDDVRGLKEEVSIVGGVVACVLAF